MVNIQSQVRKHTSVVSATPEAKAGGSFVSRATDKTSLSNITRPHLRKGKDGKKYWTYYSLGVGFWHAPIEYSLRATAANLPVYIVSVPGFPAHIGHHSNSSSFSTNATVTEYY